MIILTKRATIFAAGCFAFFFTILSCLFIYAVGVSTWFSNLFFDKLVVFLLTPPFMFGVLLIEKSITSVTVIRTKGRIHALLIQLIQQYLFGFLYLTIWFILLILFSLIKFGGIFTGSDAISILQWYFRFQLGFMILINVSALFKKSNIKLFTSASYILTYVLFALELLAVIPELDKQLGIEINLVFSWMFYDSAVGLAAMIALLLILTGGLLVAAKREELF